MSNVYSVLLNAPAAVRTQIAALRRDDVVSMEGIVRPAPACILNALSCIAVVDNVLIVSIPTNGEDHGGALGIVLGKIHVTDGGDAAWVFPYQDNGSCKLVIDNGRCNYMTSKWYYQHEDHATYDASNPVRVLSDAVKPPRTITIGKYVFTFSWSKRQW